MKKGMTSLIVVTLLMVSAFALPALAAPSIKVEPTRTHVGSMVSVKGSGFTSNSTVTMSMVLRNNTKAMVGNATTDGKGSFTANFTIPKDFGGLKKVEVVDKMNVTAQETVTVLPKVAGLIDIERERKTTRVAPGTTVSIEGSGAVETMVLSIDNGPVAGKAIIDPNTGDFRYQFAAVGSPGLHVVSIYNESGELVNRFLYNITGVSNSDLLLRIRRLEFGLAFVIEKTTDVFSQVSRSAIASDANALIIRQDLQRIQKGLLDSMKSTQAELLANITKSVSSIDETVSSSSSRLSRDISSLKGSMEDSSKALRESVSSVDQRVREVSSLVTTVRQEITSSSAKLEGSLGKLGEALSSFRTESSNSLRSITSAIAEAKEATSRSVAENSALLGESVRIVSDNLQNLVIISIVVSALAVVVTLVTRVAPSRKAQ